MTGRRTGREGCGTAALGGCKAGQAAEAADDAGAECAKQRFCFGGDGMKTAIYIEDGVVQLVITPESEWEKSALRSFETKPMEAKIFAGTFYDCRGGWTRQRDYSSQVYDRTDSNDRSLILRMTEAPKMPEEGQ